MATVLNRELVGKSVTTSGSEFELSALGNYSQVDEECFQDFANLKKISLSDNHFSSLPSGLFQGLSFLVDLNLSGNSLTRIDLEWFLNLTELKSLDLSHNLITELPDLAFRDLPYLTDLDLGSNLISQVNPNAFLNLPSLTLLDLSFNRIKLLRLSQFDSVPAATVVVLRTKDSKPDLSAVEDGIRKRSNNVSNLLFDYLIRRNLKMPINQIKRVLSEEKPVDILINYGFPQSIMSDYDSKLSNDSFRKLFMHGDVTRLDYFLNKNKSSLLDYDLASFLDIALLNDHENSAICLLNVCFHNLVETDFIISEIKSFFDHHVRSTRQEWRRFVKDTNLYFEKVSSSVTNFEWMITRLPKWNNFFRKAFDFCIQTHPSCVVYDFRLLLDNDKFRESQMAGNELRKPLKLDPTGTREIRISVDDNSNDLMAETKSPLSCMIDDNLLLKHQLVSKLTHLKWRYVPSIMYYGDVIAYFIFLIFFVFNWKAVRRNMPLQWVITVFLAYFIISELFILILIVKKKRQKLHHLHYVLNLFKVSTFVLCEMALFLPDSTFRTSLYSVTVFLVYLVFGLKLDKMPIIGPYSSVMKRVFEHSVPLLPILIILYFGILHSLENSLINLSGSIQNISIGTVSEDAHSFSHSALLSVNLIEYMSNPLEINFDKHQLSMNVQLTIKLLGLYVLLLLLVAFMIIMMYSLLIGVAVKHVGLVIDDSQLELTKIRLGFVLDVEEAFKMFLHRDMPFNGRDIYKKKTRSKLRV